jgi:hypothetical protein
MRAYDPKRKLARSIKTWSEQAGEHGSRGHNHRMTRSCNANQSVASTRERLWYGTPPSARLTFIVDKPVRECRIKDQTSQALAFFDDNIAQLTSGGGLQTILRA